MTNGNNKNTKKFFIIDGNAYIYRSYYAIADLKTSGNLPVNAVYGFVNFLLNLIKKEKMDYICICFDAHRKTFRNEIYSEYKATRKKMPDDLVLQVPMIKDFVRKFGIQMFEYEGYEADDLIATIVGKTKTCELDIYVVSGDKDIVQLVDENVRVLPLPKKEILDLEYVKQNYGFKNPASILEYMSITGDKSDNIPGIKGIGEEGAKCLIQQYETVENILNSIESVDKKYKDKILQNIENLKLSRELVALFSAVPIDFSIAEMSFSEPKNRDAVLEILGMLRTFEFFSLIEKAKELFEKPILDTDDLFMQNFEKTEAAQQTEKIQNENDGEIKIVNELNLLDAIENDGNIDLEFENIAITFSDDFKDVYFYNQNLCENFYRLSFEDIYFHKDKLQNLFGKIKNVCTDNAKYFYKMAAEIGFDSESDGYEIFDVLLAGYILDASLQNTKLVYNKFLQQSFDDKKLANRLQAIFKLVEPLKVELENNGLTEIYYSIDLKFCKVLAEIEKNGIKVDVNYLVKFRDELNSKIGNIVKEIYAQTGSVFNLNSPKQLAEVLFEKLKLPVIKKNKTGLSTSEEVLLELAKTSEIPSKILEYREINKIVSTYISPILELIDFRQRIKTSFNFTNTNTGRLSSSNPNLQNIPVKTDLANDLRKAFVCDENYWLVSVDYSQIDLVVLAHMSRDINMCRAFLNGQDIHNWTASQIFGKGESLITKKERDIAKRINFGLVYGISPYGLSQDLDISMEESKSIIDIYFRNYPQLKDYLDSTIKQAKDLGFVKTILGRKRYVPELKSANVQMQKFGERIATNTPIQGSSADIIKKAMVDVCEHFETKFDEVKVLLQIHDEILFEIRENILESSIKIIKQKMESAIKLSVPLKVNVKKGKTWAELE